MSTAMEELKKMKEDSAAAKAVEPKTYVHVLLDDSVSMQSRKGEAIRLFNQQVEVVRAMCKGQNIRVSLIKFSSQVSDPVYWDADPLKLDKIDEVIYNPEGHSTRLMDGIGISIAKLKALPDIENEDVAVLFMIVTDGEENDSQEFKHAAILDLISECEKGRWTFTFLGASKESLAEAEKIGIKSGNTVLAAGAADMGRVSMRGAVGTMSYFNNRVPGAFTQFSNHYAATEGMSEADLQAELDKGLHKTD